jgi:hypothetical protein
MVDSPEATGEAKMERLFSRPVTESAEGALRIRPKG